MTPNGQPTDEQRRQVEEFTKAGARIQRQRGVYGGSRPAALAWLLTFAQEDARTYSLGELSDRWEEVKRFAHDGGLGFAEPPLSNQAGARPVIPGPRDKHTILMLQQELKAYLDIYIEHGEVRTNGVTIDMLVRRAPPGLSVNADAHPAFLYQAFHLLGEIGQRIRKCRRCQKLFLAGRSDKTFCSGTCQATKWKADHSEKKAQVKPKKKRLRKGGKHATTR